MIRIFLLHSDRLSLASSVNNFTCCKVALAHILLHYIQHVTSLLLSPLTHYIKTPPKSNILLFDQYFWSRGSLSCGECTALGRL